MPSERPPVISVMLAVTDAPRAVEWYERALGARQLWNLGSVVGLEVEGAPFFVGELSNNGWESPEKRGEGFTDFFGHLWFVGNRSPLARFRSSGRLQAVA